MGQHERPQLEPGQEWVWDYPRPPRVEATPKHVSVRFNGVVVADSTRAMRVLETSHPPTYYFPPEDVNQSALQASASTTFCEYKGRATYFDLVVGDRVSENAAWCYRNPAPGYGVLRDYVAFYASRVDCCTVDGEIVQPQAGGFYGGWVTSEIVGPLKGVPGSERW